MPFLSRENSYLEKSNYTYVNKSPRGKQTVQLDEIWIMVAVAMILKRFQLPDPSCDMPILKTTSAITISPVINIKQDNAGLISFSLFLLLFLKQRPSFERVVWCCRISIPMLLQSTQQKDYFSFLSRVVNVSGLLLRQCLRYFMGVTTNNL